MLTLKDKLRQIVAEYQSVEVETIKENTEFCEELGLDSLDLIELIMTVEDTVGLEIPDEIAFKFNTVNEVYEYLIKQKPKLAEENFELA